MKQSPVVDSYCRSWNLSRPREISRSPVANVFEVSIEEGKAILKVFTPLGQADEKSGAAALRAYSGRGAIRLLNADEHAHLLEFAEGPDLTGMVKEGKEVEATSIIADTLNALHEAQTTKSDEFLSLRDRFSSLFKMESEKAAPKATNLFGRAVEVAKRLLSDEREKVILHGDMHHQNVLFSKARGWLAINPKGIYGERTYDAANTFFNPHLPQLITDEYRVLNVAKALATKMKVDVSRLLAFGFVHGCLSACWSLEDQQDPRLAIQVSEILLRHASKF